MQRLNCTVAAGVSLPRVEIGEGTVGPKILVCGENELSDDYWKQAKQNPAVMRWMRAGWIEEVGEAEPEFPTLKGTSAADAIALVEDTSDMGLLGDWLESEARVTVRNAIEERLDELE